MHLQTKLTFLTVILYLISLFSLNFPAYCESPRETPVVKVVRDCTPAVVNISTERIILLRQHPFWGGYGSAFDSFFDDYYQQYPLGALKLKSVGSGIVIRKDGLVLTNAHVVNMASKIFVIFSDGTQAEGKVTAISQDNDVALIKIEPPASLKVIRFAKPDDLMIGETVVAIGNPLGLENSVTTGVVSGKNRVFALPNGSPVFSNLVQIDAPINPGNSGGALLNLDGELIGITLAVVQNAQNIGFAIPIKKINDLLTEYDRRAPASSKKPTGYKIPVKVITN